MGDFGWPPGCAPQNEKSSLFHALRLGNICVLLYMVKNMGNSCTKWLLCYESSQKVKISGIDGQSEA